MWVRRLASLLSAALVGSLLLCIPGSGAAAVVSYPAAGEYVPLTPYRVVDTRTSLGITGKVSTTASLMQVTDTGPVVGGVKQGVPKTGVLAVAVTVTVNTPSATGSLQLYNADLSGAAIPAVSTVLFNAGAARGNSAIVEVSAAGKLAVKVSAGTADVIVDVQGYYTDETTASPKASFVPLTASRVYDSKAIPSPLGASTSRQVDVKSKVPALAALSASDITAVVVNVSAVGPTADTFLRAWGPGSMPATGALSVSSGVSVTAMVQLALDSTGKITVWNSAGSTNITVDVFGYYRSTEDSGSFFVPADQSVGGRVFSTKTGLNTSVAPMSANVAQTISFATARNSLGNLATPTDAEHPVTAVVLSVQVIATTGSAAGTANAWPAGSTQPSGTSFMNFPANVSTQGTVVVKTGTNAGISLLVSTRTDVVVDVEGYFVADLTWHGSITSFTTSRTSVSSSDPTAALQVVLSESTFGSTSHISIYDTTTGRRVIDCVDPVVNFCPARITVPFGETHTYRAFVAADAPTDALPSVQVAAKSATVTVVNQGWTGKFDQFTADPSSVDITSPTTTVTARLSVPTTNTPYRVSVYDTASNVRVAECGATGAVSGCRAEVEVPTGQTRVFRAFVATTAPQTSLPPEPAASSALLAVANAGTAPGPTGIQAAKVVTASGSLPAAGGLAVVGGKGYVTGSGAIFVIDLQSFASTRIAGSGSTTCTANTNPLLAGVSPTSPLTSDGTDLYWLCSDSSGVSHPWHMPLAGGPVSMLPSAPNGLKTLQASAGGLLGTTYDQVLRLDPSSGAQTVLATVPLAPGATLRGVVADSPTTAWVLTGASCSYIGGQQCVSISRLELSSGILTPLPGWNPTSSVASFLQGPVVAGAEDLFAVDGLRVSAISKATGLLRVLAGSGSPGHLDGVGAEAWFSATRGLAVEGDHLWVTEGQTSPFSLRLLTQAAPASPRQPEQSAQSTLRTSGILVPFVGNPSTVVADGQGVQASFARIAGMHVVRDQLYVMDAARLRRVSLATGQVVTVAGDSSTSGYCGDAVDPAAAKIRPGWLNWMTDDGQFLYWTSDCGGYDKQIERMSLATGAVSRLAWNGSTYDSIAGLTVGPDRRLYALVGSHLSRVDFGSGEIVPIATVPSYSKLTSDGSRLWVMSPINCQETSGDVCRSVSYFDPTEATPQPHEMARYPLYYDQNPHPYSVLVGAGRYLYSDLVGHRAQPVTHALQRWDVETGTASTVPLGGFSVYKMEVGLDRVFVTGNDQPNIIYELLEAPPGPAPAAAELGTSAPVDARMGALTLSRHDLSIQSVGPGLNWTRSYSSAPRAGGMSSIGFGWVVGTNMSLLPAGTPAASSSVQVQQEDGTLLPFTKNANGSYSAPERVRSTLSRRSDGTFLYVRSIHEQFVFDATGGLASVGDSNGNRVSLTYETSGAKRLTRLKDGKGRYLDLTYDGTSNRVAHVTDFTGRHVDYTYNASGELVSATGLDGLAEIYAYDSQHRLTSIQRPGVPASSAITVTYDGTSTRVATYADELGKTTRYGYATASDGTATTTITDPLGNQTSVLMLGYRVLRTTSATAAGPATTTYEYNAANQPTKVRDPLGRAHKFVYDSDGNQTQVLDPLGRYQQFTYDEDRQVTSVTDPEMRTTSYAYDGRGNLTSVTDAAGARSTYTYYPDGNASSSMGPLAQPGQQFEGQKTAFTFDSYGYPQSVTSPGGLKVETTYDSVGRLRSRTAAGSFDAATMTAGARQTTTYRYDTVGRLSEIQAPGRASATVMTYDAATGLPSTVTDPIGRVTKVIPDLTGRKWKVTENLGSAAERTTTYTYDDAGNLVDTSAPGEPIHHLSFDASHRVVSQVEGTQTTTFGYDVAGQLLKVTAPSGKVTTNAYDAGGQLISTSSLGIQTTFRYDSAGRVRSKKSTGQEGQTTYTRDGLGRVTEESRPDGSLLDYTYDLAGNLRTFSDARGVVAASYGYDVDGHRTSVTRDGQASTTTWVDGRPVAVREAGASGPTAYGYDVAGRPNAVRYPTADVPNVSYGYDDADRRTTMTTGSAATTWVFNPDDTVASITGPQGAVGYTYDVAGRRKSTTYPAVGSDPARSVSYDYDAATGRLSDVRDWLGGDFHYTWNDDGQVDTLSFPNGVGTAFTYDSVSGEVARVRTTSPNELLNVSYTYRAVGEQMVGTEQRVGVPAGGGAASTASRSYGFDDLGRLSSASINDGVGSAVDGTYGFDAADRITKVFDGTALAYDGVGQLGTATADGGAVTSFTFDARGNRTGQSTSGSSTTYSYDGADQLTGRSSSWSPTAYTYTYAGDGLRATVTASGGSAAGFVWDRAARVPMLLGDGTNRFVYGPDGTPLAQYPLGGGSVTYLHADAAGSVRAATDAGGVVTGTWDYDPYGNTRAHTGTTVTALQYGGQYKDPTGLYYLRARYYDPVTAQFLTRDPLQDATNSPYGYTSGNPLQYGDPLGLFGWRNIAAGALVVGAAVVGGACVAMTAGICGGAIAGLAISAGLNAGAAVGAYTLTTDIHQWSWQGTGQAAAWSLASDIGATAIGAGVSLVRARGAWLGVQKFEASTSSRLAAGSGSGSGPWAEGVGARAGGAVGQVTAGSCVSACGAMLSGRSQAELLGKLGDWSNPKALARELGDGWEGGFFGSAEDAIAAASRGPMGATLQAGTRPGHMVVTSPLGKGRFLVRDPWAGGSTYEVGSDWIGQYVSGGVFR